MKWKIVFGISLLFSLFHERALSEESSLHFKHITVDEGLPQNSVHSVLQDGQGFLWFGTQDGLVRYDGYDFKLFKNNQDDPLSLSNNSIKVIYEDSNSFLWVGTLGGGLNLYDPLTESFKHKYVNSTDTANLGNENIKSIFEDKTGTLWVGTDQGLFKFNSQTQEFNYKHLYRRKTNSAVRDKIEVITEDSNGFLWIGTNKGLVRLNYNTGEFKRYQQDHNTKNSISHNDVWSIIEDNNQTLWIGTYSGGMNHFDPITERFTHFRAGPKNTNSLSSDAVLAIHQDSDRVLWIGTSGGGLDTYDPRTNIFTNYHVDKDNKSSLNDNNIYAIYEDNQNTIWLGTYSGGINYFKPSSRKFGHFSLKRKSNMSNNGVWSVMQDSQSDLWVGTWHGGLYRINSNGLGTKHYILEQNKSNSINNNSVWSLTEDSKGTIWIGTQGGLNSYDVETNQFTNYDIERDKKNTKINDAVWTITEGQDGILWLGTYGKGINRFDPQKGTFKRYLYNEKVENSLSSNTVWSIEQDRLGILWIGTEGGLNRFDPTTDQFTSFKNFPKDHSSLSNNRVLDVFESSNGTIWVGTANGLNRLNSYSAKFKRYFEKDGLANNVIYSIEEDDRGNLWLSTNKGLSKFNPKLETFINYSVNDGLQNNEFNVGASFKGKKGELFFGGINGFNRFIPNRIAEQTNRYKVHFTDMLVSNRSVPIIPRLEDAYESSTVEYFLSKNIGLTTSLTLSHHERIVSFEFSALDLYSPKTVTYAYRLKGLNSNWVITNYKNRRATFTDLYSGNYVLEVKASNDGVNWGEITSINLKVIPPPWRSMWAYILYAHIVLALFWLFVMYQKRKRERLKLLVSERTAELKVRTVELEMHRDNLEQLVNERTLKLVRSQEETLKINEQLHRTEKMQALGNLTGGISHDFNNILAVILGYADLSKMQVSGQSKLEAFIEHIIHAANRGAALTKKLRALSLTELRDAKKLDLKFILENQRDFLQKVLTVNINLVIDVNDDIWPIWSSSNELEDALLNLSINAMHAMSDNNGSSVLMIRATNIRLTASESDKLELPAGDYVKLCIKDNGCGMTKEVKNRLFEPFYTTKGDKGTGLGLSMVFRFVKNIGGAIHVNSNLGKGSEFSLFFPKCGKVKKKSSTTSFQGEIKFGENKKILVVDDELALCECVYEYLTIQGYDVYIATSAEAALHILEHEEIQLMLTDVVMANTNGHELAAIVQKKYPAVKIQLASGYISGKVVYQLDEELSQRIIEKPYDMNNLIKIIQELLE